MIYLDNNATTKVSQEVFSEMVPYLQEQYGNPSSSYVLGESAGKAVFKARERVSQLLGSKPQEIIFTASGSESNNMAIKGSLLMDDKKRHMVISSVEHPAVYNQAQYFRNLGYRITIIGVDEVGNLNLKELENSLSEETAIVSIMYVNNETGVVFPIEEIGDMVKKRKILFHVDAVQAPGKIPIDVNKMRVDFLSISGHKFHAPKGVGALYIREGAKLETIIHGGGQERGFRAGTENVPYIAAIGWAAELALEDLKKASSEIKKLRDLLENTILDEIPFSILNGNRDMRVPNTTSISFGGIDGLNLLFMLNKEQIFASIGSACNAGIHKPSRVLKAMGVSDQLSMSTIRFSLSKFSTAYEIETVIERIKLIVTKLRSNN